MQKVITINLNGNAYQLDESAFEIIRAYLDRAERQLKDNPDRGEIMADFEQAIADKCRKFLGPQKTVMAAAEMEQIVAEMGPVEGGDDTGATGEPGKKEGGMGDSTRTSAAAPKRFYRIREGKMIAGVCRGLAAYFDIDPTIVRIVFVALLLVTQGAFILVYFALMLVVPEATTSEEHAAAHGAPFNAQELLNQAKRHAEQFKQQAEHFAEHGEWRQYLPGHNREWRAQHRAWRRHFRRTVREQTAWARGQAQWARGWGRYWGPEGHVGYTTQVWAGLLMPVFSLVSFALFVWLAFTIFTLVTTGAILGWALPAGMPVWAAVIILLVGYQLVTSPIRAARHASYYAWGRHNGWFAIWDGVFAMAMTCLVIWLFYHYVPPVENFRDFMQKLPDVIRAIGRDVRMWIQDFGVWLRGFADAF